jgi:hypothetical protein
MDAKPPLVEIGRRMLEVDLEAASFGHGASARQGPRAMTVDFDIA